METRKSQKPSTSGSQQTEIETEILHKRVMEKEIRLRAEAEQLSSQREEFEREKEQFAREYATRQNELLARERDLKKWSDHYDLFRNEKVSGKRDELPPTQPDLDQTRAAGLNACEGFSCHEHGGGSAAPKVSFRQATESVPSFSGYNIPLSQFTRACRRAKEIIPPASEKNLTKLLINKLHGRAYYAVEDEPCDTVTQLIDLLIRAFGQENSSPIPR